MRNKASGGERHPIKYLAPILRFAEARRPSVADTKRLAGVLLQKLNCRDCPLVPIRPQLSSTIQCPNKSVLTSML